MDIPERLAQKMQQSPELHGAALQSIMEFKPWFTHSKTPFFPEYTDHSWIHVVQTAATASSLIRDEAWSEVTPADACVLFLAVLLHDSGMHLTEDGFLALISDESSKRGVEGWPEERWASLWADFLSEASRFDARKLIALFGEPKPVHSPPPDPRDWTLRDRLLIGEFLRRHHHRLAHEIAAHGAPTLEYSALRLKGVPGDLADLAGLIARSHGLPLRASIPALSRFDLREYKGVHAVFLMCVLRIADYLQVQAERAPTQILHVQRLRSPLSQREWGVHEAIRDIRNTHEDPEAIYVDTIPKSAATFLKLRRLLTGMQDEIDAAWAVLGEVYGRYGALQRLGLTLRRVRSNLDSPTFADSVAYVPSEVTFDSAGTELLKLLIQPLYGEHPEIGVRELIQNAVDACRELRDYLTKDRAVIQPEFTAQDGDVVVSLVDKGEDGRWLEVSDRGVGMTLEVLRQYFLKAGASFRRSDAWRKVHETSEGKSRVLRSGRFGVGVLAAFLVGQEIEVSTRHLTGGVESGLIFKATIDTEAIDLMKYPRPVGTTIRVRISEETTWKQLSARHASWSVDSATGAYTARSGQESWDWYCLSEPKVLRVIDGENQQQSFSCPEANSELRPGWHRISHADYKDIQWSHNEGPYLACNGIIVTRKPEWIPARSMENLGNSSGYPFQLPNVSVFDPDGNLPLTLQRTGLTVAKYPFHQQLFDDVVRDWLAFFLVYAPEMPISGPALPEYNRLYAGLEQRYGPTWRHTLSWLFCSADRGVYPPDSWNIRQGNFHRFLIATGSIIGHFGPDSLHRETRGDLVVPIFECSGVQAHRRWNRFALCGDFDQGFGCLKDFNASCRRMLLSKSEYQAIERGGIISSYLWDRVTEESSNDNWVVVRAGNCNCGGHRDLLTLSNGVPKTSNYPVIIEWHLADTQIPQKDLSPLAQLWSKTLPSPLVHYDLDERHAMFATAYSEMKDSIAGHQMKLVEDRERERPKAKK